MVAHFDTLDDEKERKKYKAGLQGAFARVAYRFGGAQRGYVVGLIADLVVTNEAYKVEQRETKTQIKLHNEMRAAQDRMVTLTLKSISARFTPATTVLTK